MTSKVSVAMLLKLCAFVTVVMALPVHSASLETVAEIGAGVEHSDNVTRSEAEPRSDVESRVFLNLGLLGTTAQFDTDIAYTFTARDFKNDVQSDDEVVDGQANVLWTPLPDRFAWELNHSASDSVRNDQLADTSDNRRQRNILSTGPNFSVRLSSADQLTAELRYVDVSIEDSSTGDRFDEAGDVDGDSERQIGRVRWTHRLSSISDFVANVEHEDVEASFDVVYNRLLVGYAARLRNGSYEILVGANKVEPEEQDEFDASVFQIAITQDFGGQNLNLTLVKEVTDTSVGLGASGLRSDTFNPRDSNFDTFDVIERQRVDLSYRNLLLCAACSVDVRAFFDDQNYQTEVDARSLITQTGDQKSYGFGAGFAYDLSARMTLLAQADYDVIEFLESVDGLEYETTEYVLGFDYRFIRSLSVALQVRQLKRDSNVEGLDYDELRGGVSFRYIF